MAVNLEKGDKVSLSKGGGSLSRIELGLGWNPNTSGNEEFDLDASAFLLRANGKIGSSGDFVFYNNKFSTDGSTEGADDDRTGGSSDGDDEVIKVDLTKVNPDVTSIVFTATIDKAEERNQFFGRVDDAYIRVVDADTNTEIVRYDLTGDFSKDTAVVLGEVARAGSSWEFKALGEGVTGGLYAVCKKFGVDV